MDALQMLRFDSKLVRLKGGMLFNPQGIGMFLFQTGSIKRKITAGNKIQLSLFLFQTGSIKSLEHFHKRVESMKFLFQTGSIKSNVHTNHVSSSVVKFLFQTGSIKSS